MTELGDIQAPPQPCEPLTLAEVIDRLNAMAAAHPERLSWHVHLLDMEDDDAPRELWSGLLTHVEHDCYSGEQGLVVDLMAWRDHDTWSAKFRGAPRG